MKPASTPETTLLRWSDEEHDILVQMTNDQLELEEEDESMVISWTKHWKLVSLRLQERGYSRTPNACRGYWKRGMESQKANQQAAGPRWDDSEHQILMGMTEDQLELEKIDPSSIIPWARHWKTVSLQLLENGYTRSADACAAYWALVQTNSEHDVVSANGAAAYDQYWEAYDGIEDEDLPPVAPGDTSTQQSTKVHPWPIEEHENLLRLLKARRELEKEQGLERLSGLQLWTVVSRSHQLNGFYRTWEACKTYWQIEGRSRSGFDERPKPSSNSGTESRLFESRPSSVSSLWSPTIDLEDATMVSETFIPGNPTYLQDGGSQTGAGALQNQFHSPDPNFILTTLTNALSPDTESLGQINSQTQGEKNERRLQLVRQPLNLSEIISPEQPKDKAFRFKPHQKVLLEAEVAKHGFCPDPERREKLATTLGVEEKTIRNWFINARHKSKKTQGSPIIICASMSASNNLDCTSSNKRPLVHTPAELSQASVNTATMDGSGGNGTPNRTNPFKKPRLGDMPGQSPSTSLQDRAPYNTAEVPLNGMQTSPAEALSVARGQGREEQSLGNTTNQNGQLPNPSVNPACQVSQNIGIKPLFENGVEIGGLLTEQPSLILKPVTANGPQQTLAGITINPDTTAPATSSPKPIRENGSSLISSKVNSQSGQNSPAIPQVATTNSATQSTPAATDEESKAWASSKVQNFQSEIQKLNRDTAVRTNTVTMIEQEIEDFNKEHDKYYQEKEEETKRVLREIEERYDRKHEMLNAKLKTRSITKQSELDELEKNALEVSRKERGLKRFQAVVEYYESEGDG